MNSEANVKNWQRAIVADAARKLGRPLAHHETEFITARGEFIALEIIHDPVTAAERDELGTSQIATSKRVNGVRHDEPPRKSR